MTCLHLSLISLILLLLVTFYCSFAWGWWISLATYIPGATFLLGEPFLNNTNIVLIAITFVFSIPFIRQLLFARPLLAIRKSILPSIGETERIALEA